MSTLAHSAYLDSQFGEVQELPHAGSSLEHPLVYDDAAKELKAMAAAGLVAIVDERTRPSSFGALIDRITFQRLR